MTSRGSQSPLKTTDPLNSTCPKGQILCKWFGGKVLNMYMLCRKTFACVTPAMYVQEFLRQVCTLGGTIPSASSTGKKKKKKPDFWNSKNEPLRVSSTSFCGNNTMIFPESIQEWPSTRAFYLHNTELCWVWTKWDGLQCVGWSMFCFPIIWLTCSVTGNKFTAVWAFFSSLFPHKKARVQIWSVFSVSILFCFSSLTKFTSLFYPYFSGSWNLRASSPPSFKVCSMKSSEPLHR